MLKINLVLKAGDLQAAAFKAGQADLRTALSADPARATQPADDQAGPAGPQPGTA